MRKKTGYRSLLVPMMTVTGLLVAACGDGDSASSDADETTAEETAPDAEETTTSSDADETTASSEAPDGTESRADDDTTGPSGELVWAATTMPRSLSPHLTPFDGGSIPGLTMLHDRLIYLDPYTGELLPMLATSWESNEDGTVLTLTLREDATYHDDGSTVDAASIVANFDYGKALGEAHPEQAAYALVDSAEAIDDFTVQYNLAGRNAGALPTLLAAGFGMPVNPASFDRDDHTTYDAGTGPYTVTDVRPGQSITMEPYEGYWDPSAQNVEVLEVRLIDNPDTMINAVATGEIDAGAIPTASAERASQTDGVVVAGKAANSGLSLFFNPEKTGMTDPRARLALNMAVDREEIGAGPMNGECVPTVQPWNSEHPGHNADYPADYYEHDPEAARELLAEAGYPDGLSFELVTYTGPSYVPVSEVIQAQLAEAGFDVTIRQLDVAQISPGFRTEKTLDTWFTPTPYGQPPITSLTAYWLPGGYSNPGEYTNDTLVELGQELLGETDPARQSELLQSVTAALVEDPGPTLILCHSKVYYIGGEDVTGLEPMTIGYMDFRRMGKAE